MTRNHLLYFGRTMPFVDDAGVVHDESFWHLQDFSINTGDRRLYVNFVAYHTIAVFNSGAESLAKVGGSWTMTFTGEAYDRIIALYAQAVAGVAISTTQIADSVKDTPNAQGVFESFFAAAGGVAGIIVPPEMQALLGGGGGE